VEFECPFGGHQQGGSASMNRETTVYFCFGCHASGDAITFVSALEGVPPWRARRWIRERWGTDFREPQGALVDEIGDILSPPPEEPRRQLGFIEQWPESIARVDWLGVCARLGEAPQSLRYLIDREFSGFALDSWEVGWCTVTGRVAIPVHDDEGRLVGFKGRSTDGSEPKYVVLGDKEGRDARWGFSTYPIGEVVFGLHRCEPDVVVCEGELNAIALHDTGVSGAAIAHARATRRQLELLRKRAHSATLFLDDDEAGRSGTHALARQLEPFMPVRVVLPHEGDPAEMTAQERVNAVKNAVSYLQWQMID
jgi:DNA primase